MGAPGDTAPGEMAGEIAGEGRSKTSASSMAKVRDRAGRLGLLFAVPRDHRRRRLNGPLWCPSSWSEVTDGDAMEDADVVDESMIEGTHEGTGNTLSWCGCGPGRGCTGGSRGIRKRYAWATASQQVPVKQVLDLL